MLPGGVRYWRCTSSEKIYTEAYFMGPWALSPFESENKLNKKSISASFKFLNTPPDVYLICSVLLLSPRIDDRPQSTSLQLHNVIRCAGLSEVNGGLVQFKPRSHRRSCFLCSAGAGQSSFKLSLYNICTLCIQFNEGRTFPLDNCPPPGQLPHGQLSPV